MLLIHDTAEWARAIAELPAPGPLPCRKVIVFNERVAHSLRRALIEVGRVSVLAGTRFVSLLAAAREVLRAAGVVFSDDEASLREARLQAIFEQPPKLQHFRPGLLHRTPGWSAAFARTIADLEHAGLRPDDLRAAHPHAQLSDIAAIWEALDAASGQAWAPGRVVAEAGKLVARSPSSWCFDGPTLVTLGVTCSAADTGFARAIPSAQLALYAARPVRTAQLDRVAALLGDGAAVSLRRKPFDEAARARATAHDASERDILAAYFLEAPDVLSDATRPRSQGPDGTVSLEEYAGIEAEVEAAADWVARQVIEHRTPLSRIAVLCPRSKPLAALVAQRIARLGVAATDSPLPVLEAGARRAPEEEPGLRFGDPAVYVGSIAGAVGLPFDALRLIGLSEGHWPSVAREDAVLPDSMRRLHFGDRLPTAADRPLAQLQSLAAVIRNASREVALTMSHSDLNRSQREPSAVFLEAAAALARPAPPGEKQAAIPDLRVLQRDGFGPARQQVEAFRSQWPLSPAAWQAHVARRSVAPPTSWLNDSACDLDRIRAVMATGGFAASEGILRGTLPAAPPGLTSARAVSASALRELLRCPHKFLFEKLLGWGEPAGDAAPRELDALTYGSLFHKVAEDFYLAHGQDFSKRTATLQAWQAEVGKSAEQGLAAALEKLPFVNAAVRDRELLRLRGDLGRFLEAEWTAPVPAEFVAAEHPFGWDAPETLDLDGGPLFLHGFIDRIDAEAGRLIVRDFKTGKAHARRGEAAGPDVSIDIQLGVYALVARPMATARGLDLAAAYVYTGLQADRERAFRDDIADLEVATKAWLQVARDLLASGSFPRTPVPNDCSFCPFRPACGDGFHDSVGSMLANETRPELVALRRLKLEDAQ